MFTRPQNRVRVTARDFNGSKAGKSKTVTLYEATAEEVIGKLLSPTGEQSADQVSSRGNKKKTA